MVSDSCVCVRACVRVRVRVRVRVCVCVCAWDSFPFILAPYYLTPYPPFVYYSTVSTRKHSIHPKTLIPVQNVYCFVLDYTHIITYIKRFNNVKRATLCMRTRVPLWVDILYIVLCLTVLNYATISK